jgi:hypothetical protein
MNDQEKKLQYEAWLYCNERAETVYKECLHYRATKENKEWTCAVEKHQDHIFCMHHEKDKIHNKVKKDLAIHVADVRAAGNTTTNPPVRSNLRD